MRGAARRRVKVWRFHINFTAPSRGCSSRRGGAFFPGAGAASGCPCQRLNQQQAFLSLDNSRRKDSADCACVRACMRGRGTTGNSCNQAIRWVWDGRERTRPDSAAGRGRGGRSIRGGRARRPGPPPPAPAASPACPALPATRKTQEVQCIQVAQENASTLFAYCVWGVTLYVNPLRIGCLKLSWDSARRLAVRCPQL